MGIESPSADARHTALLSTRLRLKLAVDDPHEITCLQRTAAATIRFHGDDWWTSGGELQVFDVSPGYEPIWIEIGRERDLLYPERTEGGFSFSLPPGRSHGDETWLLRFQPVPDEAP